MLNEVCIDGEWITYDFIGDDSERSLQYYKKFNATMFANGSYPIRHRTVVQSSPTSENTIFYKSPNPNYPRGVMMSQGMQELGL